MPAAKLEVRIVDILGERFCPAGCQIGNSWIFVDTDHPAGFCQIAAHSLKPFIMTLAFGGDVPADFGGQGPGVARACCPHYGHPVVYEIRRLDTPQGS